MKLILTIFSILILVSCGSSRVSNVSGTGVIEKSSSLEFSGIVLTDRAKNQSYDLSSMAVEQVSIGSLVEYEGNYSHSDQTLPAGVPSKIEFTKFRIVGVEN